MERKTESLFWPRMALWWGAALDAAAAVGMCFPGLFIRVMGLRMEVDAGLAFGLLYGAPLMLGWTLLLLWAVPKPVERRGALLCVIPIIALYVAMEATLMMKGILPFPGGLAMAAFQVLLLAACALGYAQCRRAAARGGS